MTNIIAKHNFLDSKDPLHQLMASQDFLDLGSLLKVLRCNVMMNSDPPTPPAGFVLPSDSEDDIRALNNAGLTAYPARDFFEVQPRPAPTGFVADRWREIRYVDEELTRLVNYPNDRSDQPRLMVYGLGSMIKEQWTLKIVNFELQPALRESEFDWLAAGPFIYPVQCNPKDASNACVNADCPEGSACQVVEVEDRDPHCSNVCVCMTQD
ncbi:hypothetical protein Snoj_04620 [Streptomyces nojiriensis]|uniref:Uncharacterized protein n=1 Tax=Streptomyces nojiriensis TaxID=66374 RepID=A0ABQ3SEK4_9ACTN|nr:hypothetical protein [Streptomyces nojiriensis]GGS26032.1 hypothetical protein GCM10010205_65090 [Streptomyces nojiriensis]GHI66544.1 hypothetical protein Snoj_04620 [Streptomyces nojiriensis]